MTSDLSGADLAWSDLSNALVNGADFTGARVFGAVMPDGSRTYNTINPERRLRWGPTE